MTEYLNENEKRIYDALDKELQEEKGKGYRLQARNRILADINGHLMEVVYLMKELLE